MMNDRSLLQQAITLAEGGIRNGSGPFGSVIAMEGQVISEANNMVVLSNDPTAHAEMLAIRKASEILKSHDLSGCVIYTSCEPCPMCLGAIYWAGIKKVVFASDRYEAADAGFSDNLIYNEMNIDPARRTIKFIHLPDAGGKEVFKKWNEFEGKIQY
jgi:tRNA(Arg) A34 adenosine deaminase TadA